MYVQLNLPIHPTGSARARSVITESGWGSPEHPDASEEALPRGEDGRRSVLLGVSAIAHCFGNTHRTRRAAVCLGVKPVGKPDAGNPHVRFDERGRETERCRMAQATAPVLDSTCAPTARVTSGGRVHP